MLALLKTRRLLAAVVGAGFAVGAALPAHAQVDLFSRQTISGLVDARIGAADGEPSWTRGGFGKTLLSGGDGSVAVRPQLDLATVAWRPHFGWDFDAQVIAQTQPGQDHAVDLAEAYMSWKPSPFSEHLRVSARAGLMWPPASLEHDGVAWTTTRTLTPSAINTWIAEEVKVAGLEGVVTGEVADNRFSLTLAAFGDNDTSGTLLSFRGWALDDLRTTAFGTLPLPRFDTPARHPGQNDEADPSLELDGRIGGYAKIEWRPPAPVAFELFYYDNAGQPQLLKDGQWAWRTTFTDVGVTWRPAADTEVLAQGVAGRTYFGQHTPMGWYVDVNFDSAYLLATHVSGRHRFTARADWFRVEDLSFKGFDDEAERGWATTADYAYALTPRLALWVELLHVWSNRPSRADIGFGPTQAQTTMQVAARAKF